MLNNRLPMTKPPCKFTVTLFLVDMPPCKFTGALFLVDIPPCKFTGALFLVDIPPCKFTGALFLVDIPPCKYTGTLFLVDMPYCKFTRLLRRIAYQSYNTNLIYRLVHFLMVKCRSEKSYSFKHDSTESSGDYYLFHFGIKLHLGFSFRFFTTGGISYINLILYLICNLINIICLQCVIMIYY